MSHRWIEILDSPLSVEAAVRFVAEGSAGGINVFLGTTRAETNPAGQRLIALDYEAYTEMALERLTALAASAAGQWPMVKMAILHRVGRVAVAEPSVIIAVSCPHRAESFAACKWLIDQLKIDVPIWKKEVWEDGTGSWKE
jgi:molybdopterin synthase catalytic subunit